MPTRRRFLGTLGAGLAAGLSGCSMGSPPSPAATESPGTDAPSDPRKSGSPYTDVHRQISPSVTRVRVATADGTAIGSAAVYDDSRLVTNQHVVEASSDVSVVYRDGEYTTADVEGTDPYSDLAVLRVDAHPGDPDPLAFATADPAIGTEVVIIGTPFGLGDTLTSGIVSGVDRSLPAANDFTIPDAIQTDAAANPGNSGGPLVALDGTPLGLVNSGQGNDITFAISGALMARVVPALIRRGEYQHSYVGVAVQDLTPPLARANDLPHLRGVYVHEVLDGRPAASVLEGTDGETTALGERVPTGGDVIVRVDGRPMPTAGRFGTHLALETRPGDEVSMTVLRDGSRRTVDFELGTRPQPSS